MKAEAAQYNERRRLNRRLRAEWLAAAEKEPRSGPAGPMTADELERGRRRYPGSPVFGPPARLISGLPEPWRMRLLLTVGVATAVAIRLLVDGNTLLFAFLAGVTTTPLTLVVVAAIDGWLRPLLAWRRIQSDGVWTYAVVTGLTTEPRGPDSESWVILFQYHAGITPFKGKFKEGTLGRPPPPFVVGDDIPIRFHPTRPWICGWEAGRTPS